MQKDIHDTTKIASDDAARQSLRGAGLRSTASRVAVWRILQQAIAPQSHNDVVLQLASTGFDRATLYRNLTDLVEAGLAQRTDVGDHTWRFELNRPEKKGHSVETVAVHVDQKDQKDQRDQRESHPNHENHDGGHPHFMCTDCGTVACLPEVRIVVEGTRANNKVGSVDTVMLKGRCTDCDVHTEVHSDEKLTGEGEKSVQH